MFLRLFFRNFATINIVKSSNIKLNLSNETYNKIPLSVIYKQFIKFLKENGIYTPYLEISFPKTKMSYETFFKKICKLSQRDDNIIYSLFTLFFIVGSDYELYSKYRYNSNGWGDAVDFLNKINKKWVSFLWELEHFYHMKNTGAQK